MALLIAGVAILAFLCTAAVLGAVVLFLMVAFVIGPHGSGLVPEWTNPLLLLLSAAGVGYVAYKVALRTQNALTHKFGASKAG